MKTLLTSSRVQIAAAIAVLSILTIITAIPFFVSWGVTYQLGKMGVNAVIDDVNLNLFTGTIEIKNLRGNNNEDRGFNIGNAKLRLRLRSLADRQILIRSFSLSDSGLDIRKNSDGSIEIAGLSLPAASTETTQDKKPSKPWGFGIDTASLDKIEIRYQQPDWNETLKFSTVNLQQLYTWQKENVSDFSVSAEFGGGNFDISGKARPLISEPHLAAEISIKDFSFQSISPLIETLQGYALAGRLTTDLNLDFTASAHPEEDIHLSGDLKITDTRIRHTASGTEMVDLGELALRDIQVEGAGSVNVKELELNKINVLSREASKQNYNQDHVFTARNLLVKNTGIKNKNEIDVKEIALAGSSTAISTNAEGVLEIKRILSAVLPETKPEEEKKTDASEKPQSIIRVGKIVVTDDSQVHIRDNSFSPPFKMDFSKIEFTADNVDSANPEQETGFALTANIGKYGRTEIEGNAAFFAARPSLELKQKITGVNMHPFTSFSKPRIGYHIEQGQLDTDLDVNIDKGFLTAGMNIALHKFDVRNASAAEVPKPAVELPVPLTMVLDILRDGDDAIRLDVPLSGDLDSPSVGGGRLVRQAIFKAVRNAVTSYYSPLGIVTNAGNITELFSSLKLDPVNFEPGLPALSEDGIQYLDKMSALLANRPKMKVTIRGISTMKDIAALTVENVPPDETALRDLASNRAIAVEEYLISNGKMDHSRLILSRPLVKTESDEAPRVDLSM